MNTMESAAQQGDIASLYLLIEQNPYVLEEIDSTPFVETPLHTAARAGHVLFATEIMTLKPSFAWKFNPQGHRPVHLALENKHTTMVLQFIKMDKELVRAKSREGLTLLHLASRSGDVNLLTKFLKACPDSVKDLTARGETALHIAVKYGGFEAFKFLLRWLRTNTVELQTILNEKDVDGNTVLHIAATNNETQAMELLIKVMRDIDAANLGNQRAFDIINNQEIRNKLVRAEARVRRGRNIRSSVVSMNEWLIRKTGMRGNMSNEIRNAYMIVATLIATATYQAALSPPGGFRQIDAAATNNTLIPGHGPSISSKVHEGKSVMSNTNFMAFSTTNTFAFVISIFTIMFLMPRNVGWILMYASSGLLLVSCVFSMMVISPNDLTTNLVSSISIVLLPILALASILFFIPQQQE